MSRATRSKLIAPIVTGLSGKRADPTSREARTTAAAGGNRMLDYRNSPFGKDRFFKKDGKLFQRAAVEDKDGSRCLGSRSGEGLDHSRQSHYNEKAALAKTILERRQELGQSAPNEEGLAHSNSNMTASPVIPPGRRVASAAT